MKIRESDRQSIDFAEEEKLKSNNINYGEIVHKNTLGSLPAA